MTFADIDEKPKAGESKFRKTVFMNLSEGKHLISFLEEKATKAYAHWIAGAYVECLEDGCPICENNKRIIYENPEDFSKVKGYSYKRERFAVNVLDKDGETPEVKVLTGGRTLFESIGIYSSATRTEGDEPVDIRSYGWMLDVRGEGREREITPIPQYRGKDESINLEGLELFDTKNIVFKLSADEMIEALSGTSLKDIFTIRKAKKEIVDNVHPTTPSAVQEDVKEAVDRIFKKD